MINTWTVWRVDVDGQEPGASARQVEATSGRDAIDVYAAQMGLGRPLPWMRAHRELPAPPLLRRTNRDLADEILKRIEDATRHLSIDDCRKVTAMLAADLSKGETEEEKRYREVWAEARP